MIKLTYNERIRWLIRECYETGMEYDILLENMRDVDLDNLEWYGDIIHVPRYKTD